VGRRHCRSGQVTRGAGPQPIGGAERADPGHEVRPVQDVKMQVFSRFQKDLPAITIATAAASFAYNSGFLLPTDTGGVTSLPYNDILSSTIFLFPFVIFLYAAGNGILKFTQNDFDFGKKQHLIILILMFISGIFLLAIGRRETIQISFAILFLSISPFIIRISYGIFDKTEKQTVVQFVSIFFVLTVLFFHGYSDFYWNISSRNHAYVTTADCDKCRLVKIYSNFTILTEGPDKPLKFQPTNWTFSIDDTGAGQPDVH
jgi:hypothetical protein